MVMTVITFITFTFMGPTCHLHLQLSFLDPRISEILLTKPLKEAGIPEPARSLLDSSVDYKRFRREGAKAKGIRTDPFIYLLPP